MSRRVIIGVDPGGRMTGIVARRDDTCLGHELVVRQGRGVIPGPEYLLQVAERVGAWCSAWPRAVLAVEGVRLPERSSRRRATANGDGGLIALGKVVAALELYFPEAVIVMPDRHGRNLLAAYPAPLVAADELARRTGDGSLQHCRSAWDVAGRAQVLLRLAVADRARRGRAAGGLPPAAVRPDALVLAHLHLVLRSPASSASTAGTRWPRSTGTTTWPPAPRRWCAPPAPGSRTGAARSCPTRGPRSPGPCAPSSAACAGTARPARDPAARWSACR